MYRANLALGHTISRTLSNMTASASPIEDAIRVKITQGLRPSSLEIYNDSHLHAHHRAMEGNTSRETHFRLVIISDRFQERRLTARHRMVYALLSDELDRDNGIHSLQLRTLTPEENNAAFADPEPADAPHASPDEAPADQETLAANDDLKGADAQHRDGVEESTDTPSEPVRKAIPDNSPDALQQHPAAIVAAAAATPSLEDADLPDPHHPQTNHYTLQQREHRSSVSAASLDGHHDADTYVFAADDVPTYRAD